MLDSSRLPSSPRPTVAMLPALVVALMAAAAFGQASEPPPRSDTITAVSQFLLCSGNPYALCYYSGPEHAPPKTRRSVPALPCELSADGTFATCKCYAFEDGTSTNFVALPSILNPEILSDNESACGKDGRLCLNMVNQKTCAADDEPEPCKSDPSLGSCCKTAPVCGDLGQAGGAGQSFYPQASLLSTFSFQHAASYPIGSTDCSEAPTPLYAGCMTAPCGEPYGDPGQRLVDCKCPTYEGPFQFGQTAPDVDGQTASRACTLKPGYVWSAANLETPGGLAAQAPQE